MLRSFFLITLRILWRNKVTSLINILSLSIGMAAFMLIMLYVHHEMQYDKFNENYERIFRIEGDEYARLPPVIGTYVYNNIPEVENVVRLALIGEPYLSYYPENDPEKIKRIRANSFWADSTTFDVFTLPFIQGNPGSALTDPFTIVLTRKIAEDLFGYGISTGRTLKIGNYDYKVTGIIENINFSHIEIDALISGETFGKIYPNRDLNESGQNSWAWYATYILISEKSDTQIIEEKVNKVLAEINDGKLFNVEFEHFNVRPLKEIYFEGSLNILDYGLHGNLNLIRILFGLAIFILLIAIINYVNLTTARASLRAKEIAVKKIAGSSNLTLRYQVIFESMIVTSIALLIAMTLVQALLPQFNRFVLNEVDFYELNRPDTWFFLVSGVLLIGLIAGIYPAFYLTRFKSGSLMKGTLKIRSGDSLFRRGLMTFQFVVSILLIIAILINFRQLYFAKNIDHGFNTERIVLVNTPHNFPEEFSLRETFDERLMRHTDISTVSFTAGYPGGPAPTIPIEYNEKKVTMGFYCIEPDYLELMQIEIDQGRNFSETMKADKMYPNDRTDNIFGTLINETAVKEMEIKDPIGKILIYKHSDGRERRLEIIGIVKDFHYRSIHHEIEPFFMIWTVPFLFANIKISTSNIPAVVKTIEKEFKEVYGSAPFDYQFLDEQYDQQYKSDERTVKIIGYFTILAILIACMGLFALSTFMVSRRTKEIGIHKSLGASIKIIYIMLSWDFLKWILLAAVIACPIGWFLMSRWLESFAYHIDLTLDIFIIATLIAISIALLTITWQAIKTARANPVEALRYE
jgi:putative ABC transport system permease protein